MLDTNYLEADPNTLASAKQVEVVELKDGDTYTMEVTQVAKEITRLPSSKSNHICTKYIYKDSVI